MPEGPELHVAGLFVNRVCENRIFTGKVKKSAVSTKNPDVEWDEPAYTIAATTRGKEVRLSLTAAEAKQSHECDNNSKDEKKQATRKSDIHNKKTEILFRFGMSGKFKFIPKDDMAMDKHCHLNFFTTDGHVLSFHDYRRFGRWELTNEWGKNRGPCVILEYELFRKNVLDSVHKAVFKKPICEVLLDQKFFNGVGNYLRAEILYRLSVPPFVSAQSVLGAVREAEDSRVKSEGPDILQLCHDLPVEVLALNGGRGHLYDPREDQEGFASFLEWLQCYYKEGMTNMVDHNGRTIWFRGQAGPLKPKETKSRGRVSRKRKADKEKSELEDLKEDKKSARKSSLSKTRPVRKSERRSLGTNTKEMSLSEVNDRTQVPKKGRERKTTKSQSAVSRCKSLERVPLKRGTAVHPRRSLRLSKQIG